MGSVNPRRTGADPAGSPDSGGSRWLLGLIAVLAVAVLVLGAYVLWPKKPAAQPPIVPSATDGSPETTTTPTATLKTPNGDKEEEKQAEAVYRRYMKEYWATKSNGKAVADLEALRPLATGKAWEYAKEENRRTRSDAYVFTGGPPTVLVLKSRRINQDRIDLHICIDQNGRQARAQDGTLVNLPQFVSGVIQMQRVKGAWVLLDRDEKVETRSCA